MTDKGREAVVEALDMIVGGEEIVEDSVPHIPFVERIQRVGSPVPNPDLLKVGNKSVELISIRRFSSNGIPGSRNILYIQEQRLRHKLV